MGTLTRREFLDRAAGAAVAATLAGRLAAARASGMYISLNSACVHNVGWPDLAVLAAKTGYGGVDWNLNGAMAAGLDATKQLFAELNIKPTIVNLPARLSAGGAGRGRGNGRGRAAGAAGNGAAGAAAPQDTSRTAIAAPAAPPAPAPSLEDAAAFASAVGCRKMMAVLPTTAPDTTPLEDFRKKLRDQIGGYAETLARHDMRLGLEFLGPLQFRNRPNTNVFIYTLPECVKFAAECGPNVGAVLDVWHWHHSGGTAADILATDKSRIVQVHLSDAKAQPPEDVRDNQRLMPGEGIIDYNAFFGALMKIGYADSVSPEPLGRVPADMSSEDGAKLALDTTTAVMKKAGAL